MFDFDLFLLYCEKLLLKGLKLQACSVTDLDLTAGLDLKKYSRVESNQMSFYWFEIVQSCSFFFTAVVEINCIRSPWDGTAWLSARNNNANWQNFMRRATRGHGEGRKAAALTLTWHAHFGEKTERGEKDGVPLEITLSGCMRWKIRVGVRWQYLFRKTIPRRLKWNLKLSAPQSGVKPPAAPLSTSGRHRKKKQTRKMMIVMLLPANAESQPGKCNGRLKKQSQYNALPPRPVSFISFCLLGAHAVLLLSSVEGVFPISCSQQLASGSW